jgi:predicted AAA+ superfamily ATPase
MTGFVKIKNGTYRNQVITDEVFPLVKQFQLGSKGGFITVDGTGRFGKDKIRVTIASPVEYELVDATEYTGEVALVDEHSEQSDEERIADIAQRFEMLDVMTKAALNGDIRALIVSGPPGVGKSFTVEHQIERANLFQQVANVKPKHEVVKGSASAIGLYKKLYEYSDEGSVLVLDDVDSILFDEVSLNLLKGALDSGKNRKINWLLESRILKNEDIPNSFNFKGAVIFLTNLKFDQVKSSKLKDHLEALQSRCHYLDLTLDTQRDKILRIKQIAKTGALFEEMGIGEIGQDIIIDFMDTNKDKMRELSLRMAIKVAQLYKSFPMNWEAMTRATCMKAG